MEIKGDRKPWYKRRWVIALEVVVAIFILLAIFPVGGEDDPVLVIQAGSIQANNSLNSTSSHSTTDGSMFFTKRIAVVNLSDQKIPAEIVESLAEALRGQGYVETVDVFQGDKRPVDGQRLYDLYISVEMPEFSASGLLLTGREVEAKIKLTIGADFWDSRHGYIDHLSPPTVNLHTESTLDHKSVARGMEMPGNPYRQVVANISTQVCEHVTDALGKLSATYGDLATMPDGLVPEYRPLPPLPLPQSEVLSQVINGHGLMLNNHTVWTMESAETRDLLMKMLEGLKADGWRADSPQFGEEMTHYYFRATKDNLVFEAFEARGYEPRKEGERTRLVFRYSDRMSREQLGAVLEQIAKADPVPLDAWKAFGRLMSREQNDRVIEKIEDRSALPPAMEMRIIRYLKRHERKDEALRRLKKTAFLCRLDDEVDLSEVEKLGKEISGSEDWNAGTPTLEDLEDYGVRKVVKGDSFEVETGVDEPIFLHMQIDGKIHLSAITLRRASIPEGLFEISISESILDRSRCTSTSIPHSTSRPWNAFASFHLGANYWNVSIEEIGETERFVVKIKSSP